MSVFPKAPAPPEFSRTSRATVGVPVPAVISARTLRIHPRIGAFVAVPTSIALPTEVMRPESATVPGDNRTHVFLLTAPAI